MEILSPRIPLTSLEEEVAMTEVVLGAHWHMVGTGICVLAWADVLMKHGKWAGVVTEEFGSGQGNSTLP